LIMSDPSTNLFAWAIAIQAASKKEDFDCILVPSEIADMAAKKHGKAVKDGTVVSQGDFEKLTIKQLQKLAQNNGIAIGRTKNEIIKLLKSMESSIDLKSLKGAQLRFLIKKHKIGELLSKDELIEIVKQKLS